MQIHSIKATPKKDKKTIGRGGKKGTYSGRGSKGQKARAGFSSRATFEGGKSTLVAHTKKVRGKGLKAGEKPQIVNLEKLELKFTDGQEVTLVSLKEKGIIKSSQKPVKILSDGKITKKIVIKGINLSDAAKKKIEKAGGKVEK